MVCCSSFWDKDRTFTVAYGGACNQLRIAICNCPGAYCKKGNIDDTPPKLTLITMYIPVESMKPFFRLMRSGRNFSSGFAIQTLLPSKASTRVRTRDTLSRQGDALVRTLHVPGVQLLAAEVNIPGEIIPDTETKGNLWW